MTLETYIFTKNESFIFKHNVKVFRNSPFRILRNFYSDFVLILYIFFKKKYVYID